MALLDMTGQRIGMLTVVGRSDRREKKRSFWLCRCDCGNMCEPRGDALRHPDGSGAARSCGCLQKQKATKSCKARAKHGLSRSRVYVSWCHMVDRCTNPNNSRYADYGGRGVTVCASWLESFDNFYADMGEMPEGMTLERINNAKPYCKQNCHWACYFEQNNNRRGFLRIVAHDGVYSPGEYAGRLGITKNDVIQLANDNLIRSYRTGGVLL